MSDDSQHKELRIWLWILAASALFVLVVAASVIIVDKMGAGAQSFAYSGLLVLLAVASMFDLKKRIVPTVIVVALLVLWAVTVWFIAPSTVPGAIGAAFVPIVGNDLTAVVLDGIMGGFVTGGGMLALTVAVEMWTGSASFGGGDIKLLFVVGLYLGLPASLTMLLVACLIAVVFSLVMGLMRRALASGSTADRPLLKMTIPFAPAIALSTAIFLAYGPFTVF